MKAVKRYYALLLAVLLTLSCMAGCGMEAEPSDPSSSLEYTADSLLSGFEDATDATTTITTTTTTTTKRTTTTKKSTTKKSTTTSRITTTKRTEEQSVMVWIPQSGKKYHSHSGCSGMKNPSKVTKSDAIAWGYTPCKRCYG